MCVCVMAGDKCTRAGGWGTRVTVVEGGERGREDGREEGAEVKSRTITKG